MNVAFDVGADDGFHGILFAFTNPKIKVFGFEPIKGSRALILKNLKKVEFFFGNKIKNYKIINCAVSDFNGFANFYEAEYKVASSLLRTKKKLDKKWTHSDDLLFKTITKGLKVRKKYKVKVITLENFCKKHSVNKIHYLHIDAQGQDLKVIKSLKKFKNKLIEGVAEVPKKKNFSTYISEYAFQKLKTSFKKWKLKITHIEDVHKNSPYVNVYFKNLNLTEDESVKFIYPKKRLGRMFKRIFLEKQNFKDVVYSLVFRIKKKIAFFN